MPELESSITREILKKVRLIEIKTRGIVDELFSGEYHSVFKGRGIEFSEVREYQFGDDIRTIDWNVSARMDHPYVKVFQEERELVVMLMVDLSASGNFGTLRHTKHEIAAELSAVLAFSALKNNDKVGLILFSDKIELFVPPKKGKSHVLRILRELLFFKPQGKGTNISGALEYLNKVMKKKAIVFLISDFWDRDFETPLKVAGARHDFVAVRLVDRREIELPEGNLLKIRDAESGKNITVDLKSPGLLSAYREAVLRSFSGLQDVFKRYKVDYVEIDTSGQYVNSLVAFFRKRGRRR
ncbi:MAG: DUF58 domain-containing protein [FCB group bacterium]|nr:DUF58 domain-containing protein [FCB group bacterium]